jgi:hypothetical protein
MHTKQEQELQMFIQHMHQRSEQSIGSGDPQGSNGW